MSGKLGEKEAGGHGKGAARYGAKDAVGAWGL